MAGQVHGVSVAWYFVEPELAFRVKCGKKLQINTNIRRTLVGMFCVKFVMIRIALAVAGVLLVEATAMTALAASKTGRVAISYVAPENPELRRVYTLLKERRALEKLQEFLSPFRLPRTLKITLEGCDGEADAFYQDDEITFCYEYLDELWENMPAETTPGGVAPIDALIGPFLDTSLHEFAHALFDMLTLPVLGGVEDAADQVAAYIYLQLDEADARRLITGTAYAYFKEAEGDKEPLKLEAFADEHGLPAQRAYNVLCMAYGADTELFGDFVTEGYLPEERADYCEEEYEQVQDAFEALITPHMDGGLADEIFSRNWLRESNTLMQSMRNAPLSEQTQ